MNIERMERVFTCSILFYSIREERNKSIILRKLYENILT